MYRQAQRWTTVYELDIRREWRIRFDGSESLLTILRKTTAPIISDKDCIRTTDAHTPQITKQLFYATILDVKKFNAGTSQR
ncbi:unnamed protein product [Euphydryas editha]|uniref:Uncharacterized protein n=1 Tax=Euphydryas editha TaxID=104508 RepID=A0AAU9UH22_EUPED|nr:unnamed protein product [Euphydryas editha]